MSNVIAGERLPIEWGAAGSALEMESGDLHVVVPFADGALVALMDGLGHGPEAAAASAAAVPSLRAFGGLSLFTLMEQCHEALHKTRGVAMTLAAFDARNATMSWMGVGNVDGVLLRADDDHEHRSEAIALRGGVVGYRLPALKERALPVSRGDTLIMATDGIRSGFTAGLSVQLGVQEIAESVLARFAKGTDDAHVVVARYLGVDR